MHAAGCAWLTGCTDVTCMQAAASATATPDKPGVIDRQYFKQHWSVDFWRDFAVPETISDPNTPLPSRCVRLHATVPACSLLGLKPASKPPYLPLGPCASLLHNCLVPFLMQRLLPRACVQGRRVGVKVSRVGGIVPSTWCESTWKQGH